MTIGVELPREAAKRRLQFRRGIVRVKVMRACEAQRGERVLLNRSEATAWALASWLWRDVKERRRVAVCKRRRKERRGQDAGRHGRRRRPGPVSDQAIEHVGESGGRHPSGIGVPADCLK
jgi:hypothetical protein